MVQVFLVKHPPQLRDRALSVNYPVFLRKLPNCFVPASALEQYKTTYLWRSFKNIVALTDEDAIVEVEVKNITDSGYYDLNGRKLNKPKKGINIIRYSDGTTRKVLIK